MVAIHAALSAGWQSEERASLVRPVKVLSARGRAGYTIANGSLPRIMPYQTLIGALARRLPRGRSRIARWLQRHPGRAPFAFVDTTGHQRDADLRDDLESLWFTGTPIGLPRAVLRTVHPGDWVIDIGANIGIVSGQLARRTGPRGHTWAIEPIARNVDRLRALQTDNHLPGLRIFAVAAGADNGVVTLRQHCTYGSGWASVTASWLNGAAVEVPLRTLDSLIAEYGPAAPRLALIKIDVEGYEPHVLAGATRTLARYRPLLYVEFNDPILRDAGSSSVALLAQLAALGYAPIDRAAGRPSALAGQVVTLWCIPQDQPRMRP